MVFNRFKHILRAATALSVALLLCACSAELMRRGGESPSTEAVSPAEAPRLPPPPYVVKSGDTLSTIAASLGIDYLALAQINDIEPPYAIYAGQVLSLAIDELTPEEIARIEAARRELIAAGLEATEESASAESDEEIPAADEGAIPQPAQEFTGVSVVIEPGDGVWQWPASGPVVAEFSPPDQKGITIAGERSDPVYAAADGVVQQVYESVPQYGRLLVIQHGLQYLGFYGHNERILVSVGDTVVKGQQVAEMGDSGTDGVKVHFELRRNARSLDPRDVIP